MKLKLAINDFPEAKDLNFGLNTEAQKKKKRIDFDIKNTNPIFFLVFKYQTYSIIFKNYFFLEKKRTKN